MQGGNASVVIYLEFAKAGHNAHLFGQKVDVPDRPHGPQSPFPPIRREDTHASSEPCCQSFLTNTPVSDLDGLLLRQTRLC